MSTKLKRYNPDDKLKEKKFEERYETIQFLFTVSFVLTDSLTLFDIVVNIFFSKEIEEYLYMRFFMAVFCLYGTLIIILGNYCMDYWDCEFSCCCGKFLENIYNACGCHVFFGGLLLIASYCIELCSVKIFFKNKEKFGEECVIWLFYALLFFSSITIIMLCFLIVNIKTEKKIKHKFD